MNWFNLKVEERAGEDFTFFVESQTFAAFPYLVDLEAAHGEGSCPCNDFLIKRQYLRKNGEEDILLRCCKHLRCAFIYYAKREIARRLGSDFDVSGLNRRQLVEWAQKDIKARIKIRKSQNKNQPAHAPYNT